MVQLILQRKTILLENINAKFQKFTLNGLGKILEINSIHYAHLDTRICSSTKT